MCDGRYAEDDAEDVPGSEKCRPGVNGIMVSDWSTETGRIVQQ